MKTKDIRLAVSPLTDHVYAGKIAKDGVAWQEKKDVTNDFLAAVVARWKNCEQTISGSDGSKYILTLRKA